MHAQPQRAIAPAIGVALLLGLTAVLASVLLAFSLSVAGGLSEPDLSPAPDADFEIDATGAWVTIEHAGGEPVAADDLALRGVDADAWDGDGEVREGDRMRTTLESDRVVVEYRGPAETETLAEETGLSA